MKRLPPGQRKDWQKCISDVRDAQNELEGAIATYNAAVTAAHGELEPAVNKMNEALAAAREFRDNFVADMEAYAGDRSDKWHESEAADAFQSWKGEWEGWDPEDIETEEPEAMSLDLDHADTMENIPEEAD